MQVPKLSAYDQETKGSQCDVQVFTSRLIPFVSESQKANNSYAKLNYPI